MKFAVTRLAARDLNSIWDYLASEDIELADRIVAELESAMYKLADNPGIGHWREELADRRHRFFLVGSYFIVYRAKPAPIQVIRVLHAARDIRALLESPEE